jgi:phospholipase/carboxylesterase
MEHGRDGTGDLMADEGERDGQPWRRGFLAMPPLPLATGARPPGQAAGTRRLGLESGRDAVLHVPRAYDPGVAAPLLVLLHGAGGDGQQMLGLCTVIAEARGILLLSPDSRGRTWDVILGAYGPDVVFIEQALAHVAERYHVNAERIGVGGFSDGASYALSIGLINGALFSDILAFSPGFAAPTEAHGSPRIFVSHGVEDEVLPIDPCSRRLVPLLRKAGYDVDYREFPAGHVVPPEMVDAAVGRFLG